MDGQEASMRRMSRLQSTQDRRLANRDRKISKSGDTTVLPMTQALMKQFKAQFGRKQLWLERTGQAARSPRRGGDGQWSGSW